MLVYVTGLYSVRDDYLPLLHQHFQQLIRVISAPLYVFTDHEIPFALPNNVHVIHWTLDAFDTYRKCMTFPGTRLPTERNPTKDTEEFMALMNTKVEMLWRAVPYIQDATHIAWIDAGILKIVKNIDASIFQNHQIAWPNKVTIPGCWNPCTPSSGRICWRFCGGFFVLPTSLIDPFYKAVTSMLDAWLRAGHLVWEVNIWAALELEEPAWFAWWAADHNDTMLRVPPWLN